MIDVIFPDDPQELIMLLMKMEERCKCWSDGKLCEFCEMPCIAREKESFAERRRKNEH